jgi:hypothetical protein
MAQQEQGSVIGSGGGPASIFWADADPSSPLSLEQLRMRQRMAELLAQQRPSDNPTIGGGIQRIGEAIGSRLSNTDLDRQSAIYEGALRKAAQAQPIPGTDPAAVTAPPPEPPPPEAPSTRGVEPIPAAVPWVPPEASAAPPPDAPPPAQPLAGGGAGATPAQLLAGRDLLARTMLANPRGTAIPAPPVAPQGGGALPPFSLDTVAAGGSSGTSRAAPDEGTPPVLFNVPTRAAASTRGVDRPPAAAPPATAWEWQPTQKPVPPVPDQRPTPEEIHGIKLMREHPLDPNYAALAKPWIEYGQQKRAAAFAQRQEAYKADLAAWMKDREQLTPTSVQERAKQAQTMVTPGASTGPVPQGVLNTPNSPFRSGVPTLPPLPPGAIPEKWANDQMKQAATDMQAADKADQSVPEALNVLHQIRTHPGRDAGIGVLGEAMQGLRGTQARGFAELLKQANGGAFLQAYQTMRGTGAISNVEGQKAEAAIARLSTAQNKEDFNHALDDFENTIRRGYETMQRKVNRPVTAYRATTDNSSFAPDRGTQKDGFEYIGGNPRLPESWKKL